MRIFLKKLLLSGCAMIGLALGFEAFIYVQMIDRRAHVHEDWLDFEKIDADIIFLGNSRTAGHIIPEHFEQPSYNIAYSGYTAQMGAYRLEYLLQKTSKPPQILLVQTDLSFAGNGGQMDNYPMKDGVLRYFFFDQIGINKYYQSFQNWRAYDAFVPLLRYKGYPLIFFKHLVGWNRWDRRGERGFWHTGKKVGDHLEITRNQDTQHLSLCQIDSICIANNIQLIGIIPPSFQNSLQPSQQELAAMQNNFEIWDFSNLFGDAESEFFYDKAHFNLEGAQIYSDSINARLVNFLAPNEN